MIALSLISLCAVMPQTFADAAPATAASLSAPIVNAPVNTTSGVRVSWSAVRGATVYRVFTKVNGSWRKLKDTTKKDFLYTNAVSGNTYTFTVRCVSADGKRFLSNFNTTGRSVTYIAAPTIKSLTNRSDGIEITWGAVSGAAKYRVFLKNGSSWKKLGDTADASFVHRNVVSGMAYTYTVRCITGTGSRYTSAYDTIGKSVMRLGEPQITGVTDENTGALIRWNAVPGASKYRLYVKNGGSWKMLAQTAELSCLHKALHDTECTYTLRCIDAGGKILSSYDTDGFIHRYLIPAELPAPEITGFDNTVYGVRIRWSAVEGAAKYRVMTKTADGWKTLKETDALSCYDTSAVSGKSAVYTICCIAGDGAYLSAYDTAGQAFTYVKPPQTNLITNTSNGPLITWERSSGAAKYRVMVKTDGDWSTLCDTAKTAFLHTEALENTVYTYSVHALNMSGEDVSGDASPQRVHLCVADPANVVYSESQFISDFYDALQVAPVVSDHPNAPLTRLSAAEILTRALAYTPKTATALSDSNSSAMLTAAYYGYFLPDDNGCIDPDRLVTESEFSSLLREAERYRALKGKRILSFGDSIMSGKGNNRSGISRMTAEKYAMSFVNYGVNGATFGFVFNHSHISDQIRSAFNNGIHADIILINGGTNDTIAAISGTANVFDSAKPYEGLFSSGMEYAMLMLRSYWSDTPALYIRAHKMSRYSVTLQKQMGAHALAVAGSHGVATVDIYSNSGFDTTDAAILNRYTAAFEGTNGPDSVHPNALGYAKFYLPLVSEKVEQLLTEE